MSNTRVSSLNSTNYSDLLNSARIKKVLDSDIAINALLLRLKQSLLSCEEFIKYLRKKHLFEQDNVDELSKQFKHFFTSNSNTQTTMYKSIHQILAFDGKLSNSKQSYIKSIIKIYDELNSLLLSITKLRKSIKDNSKKLEKDVSDSIHIAEKAKSRYISLCQDWDKLKMTDPTKTKLTLRGSKTTKEQEEDLLRKIDAADLDYKQKVDHSNSLRDKFLHTERPKIVKELKNLILEFDTAMSIQLQKYSIQTENFILNMGLIVSPVEVDKSLKSIAFSIDINNDLYQFLNKYNSKQNMKNNVLVNKNLIPVPYKKHPSMGGSSSSSSASLPSTTNRKITSRNPSSASSKKNFSNIDPLNTTSTISSPSLASTTTFANSSLPNTPLTTTSPSKNILTSSSSSFAQQSSLITSPTITSPSTRLPSTTTFTSLNDSINTNQNTIATSTTGSNKNFETFGVPLTSLIQSEDDMVPIIVRQCIYIIDEFGINIEGIYRKSANVLEVNKLKDMINKDPSNIPSLLLPSKDYHDSDIHLVASLFKLFFASLPDTLIPSEIIPELKICISIEDFDTRKNYMHGLIYKFPDAQYWTLRALLFHLKNIAKNSNQNKMNEKALSIIWGPTVIPSNDDDPTDVNFQINNMQVLLDVTEQAFEPE
ncbi:hypothetical protein TBLA_0D05140 [Henningerozyma blattae CBS 6284]|uniref:Rho-GAP domain-containing protein n=1 Tax=Henningerozyma blattae (strain ATCC 34711 / CBS 6284 / DSM 70876 / NBRC 10599 / NRRL Y-10934 / UCD 77-7) TaxID=1071380 RepID=I2H3Q5_HENB6|nr:hypothetical protein TBLA_0D05140 [Tetrapisispora blattae CBS 6284]CCH61007.1 hypothetical protein TBLA_0D05140 [Tetrapisispora blattae CBS 6284]